jgi:hypothetical protein
MIDDDLVSLIVPPTVTSTHIDMGGNMFAIDVDATGRRTIELPVSFARVLLRSGLPNSVPWFEENVTLAMSLGKPAPQPPGVNVAHMQATRPRSFTDEIAAARAGLWGGRG